ncbi:MAG: 3-oxo-tetronate kinase [Roseobacter sp.]
MTTLLGCIADDFTGATDLAGLLARAGVPVSLRIGVPDGTPTQTAAFEVIALKCRTAPVDEAVAECRDALNWLKEAGAQRFFWKYCSTFDSTSEGNIGPVAEALMQDLDVSQTIYCPAFPENGRSIYMGNLFVGAQPLAESSMKNHPLTPMLDSNLMRLLDPQVEGQVGLINRLAVARGPAAVRFELEKLASEGVAHVVVDAVADEDLRVIAQACQQMKLLTGGSAVAMPLPEIYRGEGLLERDETDVATRDVPKRGIVLSGSCSAMTRSQVDTYLKSASGFCLDPMTLKTDGLKVALDWLSAQNLEDMPIVYATATPTDVAAAQAELGVENAGTMVENAMAALAVAARDQGAARFVVAGGETSGAVTKALDVTRLDIGVEIAPGVPWTFCQSGSDQIALALKSGNFGDRDFFAKAIAVLEPS